MQIKELIRSVACALCKALGGEQKEIITLPTILSGVERPSPSDIVPQSSIKVENAYNASRITIDYMSLNIPFTKPPTILPIMSIPDSNSMDGIMDYGHNPLYIKPADPENHQIMVDWLAKEFIESKGKLANDCVYRIMVHPEDAPNDFTKSHKWYAIHRIGKVGQDAEGRYFIFKGVNNAISDPYKARDANLLWLNTGVIY